MKNLVFVADEIRAALDAKESLTGVEKRVAAYFDKDLASVYADLRDGTVFFWSERAALPAYVEKFVTGFLRKKLGVKDVRQLPF